MALTSTVTKIEAQKVNGEFTITLNLKVNDGTSDVIDRNFTEIYSKRKNDTLAIIRKRFRAQMQATIDEYKSGDVVISSPNFVAALTQLENSLIM